MDSVTEEKKKSGEDPDRWEGSVLLLETSTQTLQSDIKRAITRSRPCLEKKNKFTDVEKISQPKKMHTKVIEEGGRLPESVYHTTLRSLQAVIDNITSRRLQRQKLQQTDILITGLRVGEECPLYFLPSKERLSVDIGYSSSCYGYHTMGVLHNFNCERDDTLKASSNRRAFVEEKQFDRYIASVRYSDGHRIEAKTITGTAVVQNTCTDSGAGFTVHNTDSGAGFTVHNTQAGAGFTVHNTDSGAGFTQAAVSGQDGDNTEISVPKDKTEDSMGETGHHRRPGSWSLRKENTLLRHESGDPRHESPDLRQKNLFLSCLPQNTSTVASLHCPPDFCTSVVHFVDTRYSSGVDQMFDSCQNVIGTSELPDDLWQNAGVEDMYMSLPRSRGRGNSVAGVTVL